MNLGWGWNLGAFCLPTKHNLIRGVHMAAYWSLEMFYLICGFLEPVKRKYFKTMKEIALDIFCRIMFCHNGFKPHNICILCPTVASGFSLYFTNYLKHLSAGGKTAIPHWRCSCCKYLWLGIPCLCGSLSQRNYNWNISHESQKDETALAGKFKRPPNCQKSAQLTHKVTVNWIWTLCEPFIVFLFSP